MNPEEAIIRQMEEKINKLSEEAHKAMGRRVVRRVEEWAAYGAAVAKRVTELETSNGLMASKIAELNKAWQIRNEEACRAERVYVLDVIGAKVGISTHNGTTEYRKGATVSCHKWCDDFTQECAGGIHFFITRIEAENF